MCTWDENWKQRQGNLLSAGARVAYLRLVRP